MRTAVLRAALLTAGGVLMLLAWVALGRQAARGLSEADRSTFAFADVDCEPPVPLSRGDFLGEVQFLSNLPDRLPLAEESVATRLAEAFGAHPAVSAVRRVEVRSRRVQVTLNYRTPVLSVPSPGATRTVDGEGVLLPRFMARDGLPRLSAESISMPAGAEGKPWGDERVTVGAAVAEQLRPYRDRLAVETIRVEGNDVTIAAGYTRVHWGSPPGRERANEPDAVTKSRRFASLAEQAGGSAERDIDLASPSFRPSHR